MKIQISLSTKCNIHCKFCLKEDLRRRFKFVENIDMNTDLALDIVRKKFDTIQICSNRGEALLHPYIDGILQEAKEHDNIIWFVTNASLKNKDWWINLAKLFDSNDVVYFPLDGVGNKSHNKHRQSDFYTVLRNIESFASAGGNAIWRYILFEHNQHQVELARKMAENMGVGFVVMNSHTYNDELRKPINMKQNLTGEHLYFPCEHQEMYVNVKGFLFPCCFMANIFANRPLRRKHNERELVRLYENEMSMLNLNNNSIEYIMKNSKFFKKCMEKNSNICRGACYNWSINQI